MCCALAYATGFDKRFVDSEGVNVLVITPPGWEIAWSETVEKTNFVWASLTLVRKATTTLIRRPPHAPPPIPAETVAKPDPSPKAEPCTNNTTNTTTTAAITTPKNTSTTDVIAAPTNSTKSVPEPNNSPKAAIPPPKNTTTITTIAASTDSTYAANSTTTAVTRSPANTTTKAASHRLYTMADVVSFLASPLTSAIAAPTNTTETITESTDTPQRVYKMADVVLAVGGRHVHLVVVQVLLTISGLSTRTISFAAGLDSDQTDSADCSNTSTSTSDPPPVASTDVITAATSSHQVIDPSEWSIHNISASQTETSKRKRVGELPISQVDSSANCHLPPISLHPDSHPASLNHERTTNGFVAATAIEKAEPSTKSMVYASVDVLVDRLSEDFDAAVRDGEVRCQVYEEEDLPAIDPLESEMAVFEIPTTADIETGAPAVQIVEGTSTAGPTPPTSDPEVGGDETKSEVLMCLEDLRERDSDTEATQGDVPFASIENEVVAAAVLEECKQQSVVAMPLESGFTTEDSQAFSAPETTKSDSMQLESGLAAEVSQFFLLQMQQDPKLQLSSTSQSGIPSSQQMR
ncbi:hypothetical protein HK102_011887 [Quaeritorhiza haematococci]|nr:hypothetical protein HK102_011887 [Quaeritorhiza haematococci]